MTLSALAWVSVIGLPFLFGSAILSLVGIRLRDDLLAYPAWSWIMGTTATAFVVYVWAWTGGPIHAACIIPFVVGLALVVAGLAYRRRRRARRGIATDIEENGDAFAVGASTRHPARIVPRGRLIERAVFGLVVVAALALAADHSINANRKVVVLGDEANIWASKAKVFYLAGGFNQDLRLQTSGGVDMSLVFHQDYPMLNPLLQAWVYAHADRITHVDNRVPIQIFALALVLALAAALRRHARPLLAAVLLWCLVSAPVTRFLAQWAYADHMVALGFLVAVDAFILWRRTSERRWWGLFGLALAFMAWTKNEAMLLLVALAVATVVVGFGRLFTRRATTTNIRPSRLTPSGFGAFFTLIPLVVILALHHFTNAYFRFENDLVRGGLLSNIVPQFSERLGVISRHFAQLLFWQPHTPPERASLSELAKVFHDLLDARLPFRLVLGGFVLTIVLFPGRILRSTFNIPVLAVLAAMTGFLIVYFGSFQPIEWHLTTSMARVFYGVVPTATLLLGASLPLVWPWLGARGGVADKNSGEVDSP